MSYIGWLILLTCLCSGATLFFSVVAIALRTCSSARLLDAFREINKQHSFDRLAGNVEKLTLAASLYRLIFNMLILIMLIAAFNNSQSRHPFTNYLLAFIVATTIFSVFALAVPHALAKYAGEKILTRTYPMLTLLTAPATPAIYVFRLYDHFIRRLAGVKETSPLQRQHQQQEEFLTRLEQQKIEGVVDAEEQEMIENVLELSETAANEIMTPRTDLVAIELNADFNSVLDTITKAGHSRVPVYKENIDNIVGLVYAKDLLTDINKNQKSFNLKDKIRDAYFVPETKPIRQLLHEFQNQKLHIAVLLDEYGGTAGIVTLEDILEELVGEIADEYEKPTPGPIKKIDLSTIEADARTYIDDLNDQCELSLPENEDYDTVGGFVFSHLGYIPKTGETFDYKNLKFLITAAEPRRIKRIRIKKNTEQQNVD